MTFLEAALEVLKREGKPLHYKELTERAMGKKLLTFVGRTPEVTMQTQLTAAVKKAPGSPFVRVKPGVFGLLRYPEMPPEVEVVPVPKERKERVAKEDGVAVVAVADGDPRGEAGRGRRRRRRGGRGRTRGEGAATFAPNGHKTTDDEGADAKGEAEADEMEAEGTGSDSEGGEEHEPQSGNLSPEARAAALAETGVLEGDDAGEDEPADLEDQSDDRSPGERDDDRQAAGQSQGDADLGDDDGDDDLEDDDDEAAPGVEAGAAAGPAPEPGAEGEAEGEGTEEQRAGRRRRRRRRRRHGEEATGTGPGGSAQGSTGFGPPSASGAGTGEPSGDAGSSAGAGEGDDGGRGDAPVSESRSSGGSGGDEARARDAAADAVDAGQGARRIMTPVDAAIEILRGQAPGRGVHVRQIADAAARRRLVHGEPNEAWRVMRTALAAEPRERLRAGQRPRVRAAGSGLFALARRPPDGELERAEQVFGEARRALRERTVAALERRISELPGPAFEALARVLLQREGFGPATFVKRVEGTIYVEALRGRGSRPSRCLVGLRPGASSAGRRAIGELRAGIRARNQDEGVLLLAGRLAEDAIAEWKQAGPPVEIADGQAMAETCIRHGVGVINTMVSVDFVDADFFAELAEG